MQLDRITMNPEVMGGRPCIRGMRVTVGAIIGLLAAGHDKDAILAHYPYLDEEDIHQALIHSLRNKDIALHEYFRFIPQIWKGKGDYTKERRKWVDKMTWEDIQKGLEV